MLDILSKAAVVCLALVVTSRGAPLYSESFDTDPGYVGAKGPNDNNISTIAFGAGNAGFPKVEFGQFGGTSQYLVDAAVIGSTNKGALAIGSGAAVRGKSRNRSYATFIDTSSASVGQYRVSFDVSDFRSDDAPNTAIYGPRAAPAQ